jgi:mRNA interferase MazF
MTSAQHTNVPAHRGGVYWVEADPQSEVAPNYRHPHVVIQDDVFNRSRIDTVIVCGITSNPRRAHEPGNVRLEEGEGNLVKLSVVVVSQVSSIPKSRLGDYIGTLSSERVTQVLDGLAFIQSTYHRD